MAARYYPPLQVPGPVQFNLNSDLVHSGWDLYYFFRYLSLGTQFPVTHSQLFPGGLFMPKREFDEFYTGSTFANLEHQRPFRKTHVVGSGPTHTSRPASWTPTGSAAQSPVSSTGMPPRRKVMMVATTRRVRTVGARHRGAPVVGFQRAGGIRRVVRPQGIGPRTGGFTGIEKKFYDTHLSSAALTAPTAAAGGEHNPSATICLNSVTQGDGEEQRDGRKSTFNSCYVNGQITVPPQANITAGDGGSLVYVALILDTQTNGALLNSEDVFKNESGDANLAANPMRNMQFTQRFRILDKWTGAIQNPNLSWDGTNMESQGLVMPFTLSSNLTFNTLYSGTTEDIANITDNSLSIIAYCSNTSLAPSIAYNARVRFVG